MRGRGITFEISHDLYHVTNFMNLPYLSKIYTSFHNIKASVINTYIFFNLYLISHINQFKYVIFLQKNEYL